MKVLNERSQTHGDFVTNAMVEQALKATIRASLNWDKLLPFQKSALEMICHKMARILTGDPDFVDSWTDLVGYSELGRKFTSDLASATDVVITRKKVHEQL